MVVKDQTPRYHQANINFTKEEMISSEARRSLQNCKARPKMLCRILKTTLICTIIAQLTLGSDQLISAASNQSSPPPPQPILVSQTSTTTNQTGSGTETKPSAKTAHNAASLIAEAQQSQSTDLSSVYVQIPIAEQSDTGAPVGVQQTLISTEQDLGNGQSDDSSKSTWTGPWPKKFQIGYIKQSDLHQVLIESLKNDPFVGSLGSSADVGGSKHAQTSTASPLLSSSKSLPLSSTKASDSSSHSGGQKANGGASHWPSASSVYGHQLVGREVPRQNVNKNVYHINQHPQHGLFRDPKIALQHTFNQHQMHRFQHQQQQQQLLNTLNQMRSNFGNQQPKSMISMTNQHQQPQVQFANFPSNMLRNQPIYTINNNFQNQPEAQQFGSRPLGRPTSTYYYGPWRPVTSDKESEQAPIIAGVGKTRGPSVQIQTDSQGLSDDFEDGFSTPSKDDDSAGNSMNRHPMLNKHINGNPNLVQTNDTQTLTTPNSKVSPAMMAKTKQQQEGSTKAGSRVAGTKSSAGTKSVGGIKGGQTLTSSRRRASSSNTNNTMSTTTAASITASIPTLANTDVVPTGSSDATNSTAISPVSASNATTVTTTMQSVTTTISLDAETTEPDVEVIETETTEPTAIEAGTTQVSSTAAVTEASAAGGSSTQMGESSTQANNEQTTVTAKAAVTENGESEVVTQTSVASGAQVKSQPSVAVSGAFPSVTSSSASTEASSTASSESFNSNVTTREETTPSSAASSSSPTSVQMGTNKGAEVEGTTAAATVAAGQRISKTKTNVADSALSDEALLAEAVQTGSDIGKARSLVATSANTNKKTRSSDRLRTGTLTGKSQKNRTKSAPQMQSGEQATNGKRGKQSAVGSARSAKQVNGESLSGVKGGGGTKNSLVKSPIASAAKSAVLATKRQRSTKTGKLAAASGKSPRMAQQSEKLQQAPQVVSMTAAQAQSTAQTLASLLLARCLSSANCAHLLDICSTKQAAVPFGTTDLAALTNGSGNQTTSGAVAAWSMPIGLQSSSLMSLVQTLQADRALKLFPQWREAIENVVDQDPQTGYTIILPSNDAIERLPVATIDLWLANNEMLGQVIDNHLLDSPETIEVGLGSGAGRAAQSRVIRSKGIQVNQHRDRMVTINGKRVVYANQPAPSGGRIHIIDGILDWPAPSNGGSVNSNNQVGSTRMLDIMETLKQCDKFDGFVTLAEGTGLTQILKQDGPMTVFVPSNEALRKIPDDELELIKNNSTALKEFLMYHVVNGSYFSQDLRDGQQLASILDMKPIQVGVRVDGCSRRLVEANTSPMRRADIVAKNGVIHILDWYLTTRDNEWCGEPMNKRGIGSSEPTSSLSSSSSIETVATSPTGATNTNSAASGDRLQQLASEQSAFGTVYATRVSLPANHKPAVSSSIGGSQQHHLLRAQQQGIDDNQASNSVIVSASLLADNAQQEEAALLATRGDV